MEKPSSIPEGEALAWRRREAMLALIETDPERALALTVPFRWRETLPPRITRHFEEQIDARGDLAVLAATDMEARHATISRVATIGGRTFKAFVYGWRLKATSRTGVPLHGIALAGKLAVAASPLRVLDADESAFRAKAAAGTGKAPEAICGVSGRPADWQNQKIDADLGGETIHLCSAQHFNLVEQHWLAASGGAGFVAGANPHISETWTHGPKTVLVIRVNFPDDLTEPLTEAAAYTMMDGVNSFYVRGSYGATSLTPTVTPLITLPKTKSWYTQVGEIELLQDAREAARQAGYDTANYARDIVCETKVPGFNWSGLAFVEGKGAWLQGFTAGVASHELGHNWGLYHANAWDTSANGSITGPATHIEYGNTFDTMGKALAGNKQFNAMHKNLLGWLPDASVQHVSTNGVYRLLPFDTSRRCNGSIYALQIPRDYERDCWLEVRNGIDTNVDHWTQNGVLLNWSPWTGSAGGTHLLDTTPGSPIANPSSTSVEDAALTIGRTFTDPVGCFHLTPLARGTGTTNQWTDVQVNFGVTPGNHNPVVVVEADPTNAVPDQLVHFHATASDPDGDTLAYAWSTDDFDFSTNNLAWFAKSWPIDSQHVVRCVVSDMKGGTASAQVVVTIGGGGGYKLSGHIADPRGYPLEGVQVCNHSNLVTDFVGGVSDSEGNYVLVVPPGSVFVDALKYGYTFSNVNWSANLTVAADQAGLDIVATPMPTVTAAVDSNTVPEPGGNQRKFTLTRTTDLTNSLDVALCLSGSATPGSDYTLSPALAFGTNNVVTFPPGSNTVVFTLTVVNDGTVEVPETVTLTVLEQPLYVAVLPGSATLTITDDDQPAKPQVSVFEGKNRIQENGQDSGEFIFMRTGPPTGDLAVNYTLSGTATQGTDYPTLPGVVIIPTGSTTATVRYQPIDDKDVEPDETVICTLAANANYNFGANTAATNTILNDDLLTVTIFPTGTDCLEGSSAGRFTVQREGDITSALRVDYTVSGTASNGVDYVTLPGSVVIPAGQASVNITVTPINDALVEGDESVTLTLSNAPPCNVGVPGSATLWIHDDERPALLLGATDDVASEPGSDTGLFTISRAPLTSGNLTVYFTLSGTAVNGVDYIPLDNFVVIPNGQSQVTLEVVPFDDLHREPDETVVLTIQPGTNYAVSGLASAKVTIHDDDPNNPPAVGFAASASSAEEHLSPGITVLLSDPATQDVTVGVRLAGGTATAADYTLPTTNLTIPAGDTVAILPLTIKDNATQQADRTLRLVLFNPTNATLDGLKFHTYTIVDDDAAQVSLSATATNANESGAAGNFRFTRSGSIVSNLTVNFQVTGTASPGADYLPLGTNVVIPAGSNFVDVPVVPINDVVVEQAETVTVTLISAPSARLTGTSSVTITLGDNDTDTTPLVAVSSAARPYAVEGGTAGAFVFTRTGPVTNSLTVSCTIAGTAGNGVDYGTLNTSVTFPVGFSAVTNVVTAIDDTEIEGEETVVVALVVAPAYRVSYPSAATVIVQDNDQQARVDASDFLAAEPGTDKGEFTFSRVGTTNTPLTVFYTLSGTAANGLDYVTLPASVTIPAGRFSTTLPVIALDDSLREGSETVTVALTFNGTYALDVQSSATVTIQDDEPMVTVTATVTNTVEGSSSPGVFTVTRTGDLSYEFTVHLSVGGLAAYGVDYPPFATNILFTCGIASIDLLVAATNELVAETNENVTVQLLPDPAYTILSPSNAALTIVDAGTNAAPLITLIRPAVTNVYIRTNVTGMILRVAVTDPDGTTNAPLPTVTWTKEQGPDALVFEDINSTNTTVIFTNAGFYVLRVTADDGQSQSHRDIQVFVDADHAFASELMHWRFDEGAGTNTVDATGQGRDGLFTGTVAWSSNGITGAAADLGGTNPVVRDTSTNGLLDGLNAFTVALWVKCGNTNRSQGLFAGTGTGTNATLGLSALAAAGCGSANNVFDAIIPTTSGSGHYVSQGGRVTNGWQHLTLTWASGASPQLYVGGLPERVGARVPVLNGWLTNSPGFLLGQGPSGVVNHWGGLVDEVRVYSNALSAEAIHALATLPGTATGATNLSNFAPLVDAGTNFTIQINTTGQLSGFVADDGLPNPPAALTSFWALVTGPLTALVTDTNNLQTTVLFSEDGTYKFRLISDDGQVAMFTEVEVHATLPTRVDLSPVDGDAAELGPNPGEFQLYRTGDTNVDLPVFIHIGGIASNGVDYPFITNVIVIPMYSNEVRIPLIPYLDHRTEGDESVVITVLTNIAYTVGNSPATATIHDSPYGQWTVSHFTLEELTDPTLSGEGVDFDHDTINNLVEYSANLDPKVPDNTGTNAFSLPFVLTVETNNVGTNFLTLTYTRRLQPTDVSYTPAASSDLVTWFTGTNHFQEFTNTPDANGFTETVKTRLLQNYPFTNNEFITIQVQLMTTGP